MQSWWGVNLTAGARDSLGNIEQNDLAPEDLLCHKVRELLVANATLLAIFGPNKIEVLPSRAMLDFRTFPRLQIYPASTTETARPTQVAEHIVEVFIGVRYGDEQASPLATWAPGIASVLRSIKQVLRNNRQLADQANGINIQLASNSNSGAVNWLVDVDPRKGRIAYTYELSWLYQIKADDRTGVLYPIQDAGGN